MRREKLEDIWRPIPGFGDMYEASFDGRIRKVRGMKQGIKKQFEKGMDLKAREEHGHPEGD